MPIICKICNQEFEKLISSTHLKNHNISSKKYKELHGKFSLVSEDYRTFLSIKNKGENNPNYNKPWSNDQKRNFSSKKKGSIPWNKNKKLSEDQKENLLQGIKTREEKYQQNILIRHKSLHSDETKKKISDAIKNYNLNNSEKLKENAKKAVLTKINNGYDFGKNMRGKTHSETTKQKIKETLINTISHRQLQSYENVKQILSSLNLTLLSDISNSQLKLKCNNCKTSFSITKQYFFPSKLKKEICAVCFPRQKQNSNLEIEIFNFVKILCNDAVANYRKKYHDKELDVYIPSKNLGIELNGLYWHSENVLVSLGQSKTKDLEKLKYFQNLNIDVIQIFEDEWVNKKEIVKSRLKNILGITDHKIYARKCIVKEVDSKTAANFCKENHLMSKSRSNLRLGLYYDNNLVSLMTFSNSNISRKIKNTWEINRFCSVLNTNVIGAASKLFKHFIKTVNPNEVISYSDNRWSTGELYKKLNFEKKSNGYSNYWYIQSNVIERIHRYTLRKTLKDNQFISEYENRKNQGFNRIWDSGSSKWVWSK